MSGAEPGTPWFPDPVRKAIEAVRSPHAVAFDGSLSYAPDQYAPREEVEDARDRLRASRKALRPLQSALLAGKRFSVLVVFQALDAAGKDGAIREVFQGVNPVGLEVHSFKKPSENELAHDFLWRTASALPPRGLIGIFNRSHYEEVLIVRVHPEYLNAQYAGQPPPQDRLWPARYHAIREHELHIARANTLVLKFWLNVSPRRQARRFLERLEEPRKLWKFSPADVRESESRAAYDEAVMTMFNETSRPWAPWYCIPADDRWYARWQIAETIRQALAALPLDYPESEALSDSDAKKFKKRLRRRMRGD